MDQPRPPDWLNYHHLLYFWTVAREGSIAAACRRLHLAQPTISAQLRQLETALGHKLLERAGRGLALTQTGEVVYRYADEIFSLGHELLDTLQGRPTGSPLRLRVGIVDVLPKLIVHRLLQPALAGEQPVRLFCTEGDLPDLLRMLSAHELDVVLSDTPVPPHLAKRAHTHRLGESAVAVFGAAPLAARYKPDFPKSLEGAPMLLPAEGSVLRRALDHWFRTQGINPRIVAEFEDSALLKVFGQAGAGLFAAPTAMTADIRQQFGARPLGRLPGLSEQFFAISMERRVRHPSVLRIVAEAKASIFR